MRFELFSHSCYGLEDRKSEILSDNRCYLHGSFELVLQPVHATRNDSVNGIWNLNLVHFSAEDIAIVDLLNGAVLQ